MDIIDWVLGFADSVPWQITALLAMAFALLESGLGLGFFVPGETVVLLLSATMPSPLAALGMLLAVVIGASAGDHVGYLIGRRMGPRLRETALIRRLGTQHWDRAVDVLERRGAAAVFLTRLVPVVRTLTPASAGVARLAYPRFLVASLAGATTWAALYVGVGYALRASLDLAQDILGDAVLVLVGVAAAVVLVTILARTVLRREGVRTWLASADTRLGWRTIPNALSAGRILLAIAVAVLLANEMWFPAAAVLAIAWVTDAADGILARARDRTSPLGRILDPVADQALILAVVIGMTIGQVLPLGVAVAIVVVDVFLAIVAIVRVGAVTELATSTLPRIRTVVLLAGLLSMSIGLGLQPSATGAYAVLAGAGFVAVLVGVVLHVVSAARFAGRLLTVPTVPRA